MTNWAEGVNRPAFDKGGRSPLAFPKAETDDDLDYDEISEEEISRDNERIPETEKGQSATMQEEENESHGHSTVLLAESDRDFHRQSEVAEEDEKQPNAASADTRHVVCISGSRGRTASRNCF